MARTRTGLPTLRHLARESCRIIVKFGPVIAATFPESVALQAALASAQAACEVLVQEIDGVLTEGV